MGNATIHETNQSGSQKLSEDLDLQATIVEDPSREAGWHKSE